MCSDIAVKVENLGKCFHIYNRPRDRLLQLFARGHKRYYREFWALKDVSFEIKKGETVGIVGRNGSGKSTLLQMICGTLTPTNGTVEIQGRVAALLELGSGFNPEFTGRENVYMNAAVLGLNKEEIDRRFDDIAKFADIGAFIEQPVRAYSSGMVVRLAFAVAINVDPEILIVDEALSVGDELFQRKCFSRIEMIRKNGATILFVSHSGAQIIELCDRAMLLDASELLGHGPPKQIVGRYQKLLYAPEETCANIREQIRQSNTKHDKETLINSPPVQKILKGDPLPQESFDPSLKPASTIEYESNGAYIENPIILDGQGNPVNSLIRGRTYRYTYTVRFTRSADNVRFGMMIKTLSGVELGGAASTSHLRDNVQFVSAGKMFRVEFVFVCALNSGTYFLNAGVAGDVNGHDGYLHRLIDVAMFRVIPDSRQYTTGVVDFGCVPQIEEIAA